MTLAIGNNTISMRRASEYELDARCSPSGDIDGKQLVNQGTGSGDWDVDRNAVCFTTNDYADTSYVVGANDYVEAVVNPNQTGLDQAVIGVVSSGTSRFTLWTFDGFWGCSFKGFYVDNPAGAGLSDIPTAIGTQATLGLGGGLFFVDGVLKVDFSAATGTLPTHCIYLGARNVTGTSTGQYFNGEVLRTRIATYTDIANATGDVDADIAAGLCTLVADWRMRTQDITISPDSIIDDVGAYTILAAEIFGPNLQCSTNSTYDTGLDGGELENSSSTVADMLTTGEAFGLFCEGDLSASAEDQVWFGHSSDTAGTDVGITISSGNIVCTVWDGTASQSIGLGAIAPGANKVAFSSDGTTLRASLNGSTPSDIPVTLAGTVPTVDEAGTYADGTSLLLGEPIKSQYVTIIDTKKEPRFWSAADMADLTG